MGLPGAPLWRQRPLVFITSGLAIFLAIAQPIGARADDITNTLDFGSAAVTDTVTMSKPGPFPAVTRQ